MQLTVLGCSPAVPNPGGASSGYLVREDGTTVLVDCGHGVTAVLQNVLDLHALRGIVISHMHPDHFFDLVPLTYAFLFGQIPAIPLFVPPGGIRVLESLQVAVGLSDDFFARSFRLAEYDPRHPLRIHDLEIRFAPIRHFVTGYAMRVAPTANPDRALAYTADTGWSEAVLDLIRGAAMGLVEATLLSDAPERDRSGHLTGEEAGRLAREAEIEKLLLTHYWRRDADAIRAEASEAFGRPATLGQERQTYSV